MSFARAGWAAAAAVLLAAGGCDYWDNLVDNKTLSRADLEVKVVDAWTGEALAGASCMDSSQSVSAITDEQGVFRIVAGPTGQYAFTCGHEWYFDSVASVHLTKAGAHAVARLARRGLADWYPPAEIIRKVGIPRPDGGVVRFPLDLDWQATPADTNGRFRYEWTFLHTDRLSHGRWVDHVQLDPESYSPRFRPRASTETGVQPGPDTVILKVYSLMAMSKSGGYLVGIDTMPFEWVRNIKPYAQFDASERARYIRAGCDRAGIRLIEPVHFKADDSDGGCDSIRLWTINAPTLRTMDTLLSCTVVPGHDFAKVEIIPPRPDAQGGLPNSDNSTDYYNLLAIEITDKNGEKAKDTLTLRTHTNVPPTGWARLLDPNPTSTYLEGDPLTFEVHGHDTDGGIERIDLFWTRKDETTLAANPWFNPEPSPTATSQWTQQFTTAGQYDSKGWIIDDCEDSIPVPVPSFTVVKNTPPSIVIKNLIPAATPAGDSLTVTFDLTVTDADKSRGDSLTQVIVFWSNDTFERETSPATPFTKVPPYKHTFPLPSAGSSIPIRIQAEDDHYGVRDTTIQVQFR
ncbi:MAG: hypothetical protein JF616_05960 [Fibrobacteres bacterium]|nr:hypothetical protein [Fibrobacterota bacterium]